MPFRSWFEWIDAIPSSIALRESIYGYSILLTSHAITMAMFAGLIVMMDLRLVGLAFRRTPVTAIQKRLFPWQMLLMALSSITGVLLFYSQPMRYYGKVFFWTKMAIVLLAGVNAMVFHYTTYRSVEKWDTSDEVPRSARLAGSLSLVMWAAVVVFGRLTAYNWMTFD